MTTKPTESQITKLRDEACKASDWTTADACSDALTGDEDAMQIVRMMLGGSAD